MDWNGTRCAKFLQFGHGSAGMKDSGEVGELFMQKRQAAEVTNDGVVRVGEARRMRVTRRVIATDSGLIERDQSRAEKIQQE